MSEPLSNMLGFKKKNLIDASNDLSAKENYCTHAGYNQVVHELDQLSPDVNKLAEIICDEVHEWGDWKTADEDKKRLCLSDAQEIINKIDVWIVKKG